MIYVVDKDLLLKGQYGDIRGYSNYRGFHQGIELYQQWEAAEFDIEKFFENTKGMNWIEEDYDYRIVC